MPSAHDHEGVDVPLGEVAAEDPRESVEHEVEATESLEAPEAPEVDNDTPPRESPLTTITGMGPVSDGDDLTI
jgi:predicted flap endonuclease-1-like 5' DNA nuclease